MFDGMGVISVTYSICLAYKFEILELSISWIPRL